MCRRAPATRGRSTTRRRPQKAGRTIEEPRRAFAPRSTATSREPAASRVAPAGRTTATRNAEWHERQHDRQLERLRQTLNRRFDDRVRRHDGRVHGRRQARNACRARRPRVDRFGSRSEIGRTPGDRGLRRLFHPVSLYVSPSGALCTLLHMLCASRVSTRPSDQMDRGQRRPAIQASSTPGPRGATPIGHVRVISPASPTP